MILNLKEKILNSIYEIEEELKTSNLEISKILEELENERHTYLMEYEKEKNKRNNKIVNKCEYLNK
ncbi:hypothetical protein CWI38_0005p0060 [Hamiltosporidium tvaerminnensis]|uniref:Uncharacterized protein n=2 Tax=Hamiltosporidium TaxID=1176354 RepID=A0A4Q9LHL3_9MICR|nr:hypothetical protein CWI36_0249p0020 [Hamiltosporidium magnivora]TBU20980.1 hypothetical protein CWI38_0005p0060 [Hamiltosporidium tvaerminnensis]